MERRASPWGILLLHLLLLLLLLLLRRAFVTSKLIPNHSTLNVRTSNRPRKMASLRSLAGFCTVALLAILLCAPGSQGQINFPGHGGGGSNHRNPISPRPVPPKQKSSISGCNCLPSSECPEGFGQLGLQCVIERRGGKGVCCIPQQGLVLNRVGFVASDVAPMQISSTTIDSGFQMGRNFFDELIELEEARIRNREFLQFGDPARGHAFFFQRSPSAKKIHDLAYTIAQSSREIANMESLSPEQSFFGLPAFRIKASQCLLDDVPDCDRNARYRTIDGSCNNLQKPLFGRSETAFGRISPPLYSDGIMEPRINGVDGAPLPNVRSISNSVLLDVNLPDADFTLGVMQWAQFLDHDLTHAPFDDMGTGRAIRCCDNGRLVSPMPEQCFPITVPSSDGFYGPLGQRCINFVRSMLAINEGCAFGPVEQLNVVTHWVDGSMIYGSTEDEERRVVDLATGFMRVSNNNLPPTNRSVDCDARVKRFPCFEGGDSRINEQPALTVTHTLWVREHNRIAQFLRQKNPRWDANTLFQETRRIVVAQVQHITYDEFLPIIIGSNLMNSLRISSLQRGFRSSYNPSIDPIMFNEFATAAYRFGHSMVQGLFRLISNTGRQSTALLRDVFNAPHILQENPGLVDNFVNSLTLQNIQTFDSRITQELSNHLFQTPSTNFGMDLMSLNLQRGREHAIATYNQMRQASGIPSARAFAALQDTTSADNIRRLQSVYRHPDDIDLFVGGMTEKPLPGALLGPTFANILGLQFKNTLDGDRFFYDMGGQAGSFTSDQLQEIRRSSLASIYCANSNAAEMQPRAFHSVSPSNPRVPCNQIPFINLNVF